MFNFTASDQVSALEKLLEIKKEFTATSGAKVQLFIASFAEARTLQDCIEKVLSGRKLSLDSDLFSIAFELDSNEVFRKQIFKCLGRCLYNGIKIDENIFEDESARQDYYEIIIGCLKVNLLPFFQPLILKFKSNLQSLASVELKQKSKQVN